MTQTTAVEITSVGFLHPEGVPAGHLVIDVRQWFRNPADDPAMIQMTGLDLKVRDHVRGTRGVASFTYALVDAVLSLASLGTQTVTVVIGCAGGRHRSVAIAEWMASLLRWQAGLSVEVTHRDIGKPVVKR